MLHPCSIHALPMLYPCFSMARLRSAGNYFVHLPDSSPIGKNHNSNAGSPIYTEKATILSTLELSPLHTTPFNFNAFAPPRVSTFSPFPPFDLATFPPFNLSTFPPLTPYHPYLPLSRFSFTLNFTILLINERGRGWSRGNCTDPLALSYADSSLLKAFIPLGAG